MIACSYSRISDFEACAYRFKLKYIDKRKEEDSPATARGTAIHLQYQNCMERDEPAPSTFFAPRLEEIKQHKFWVESGWGFTRTWEICDWLDKKCWMRIKTDLTYRDGDTINVIDYKTGKESRFKHTSQGQLYAIGALIHYPDVDQAHIEFWYHDHNTTFNFDVTRKQADLLRVSWSDRAQKIQTSKFPPNPTKWNCRYCGVRQHCEYTNETV